MLFKKLSKHINFLKRIALLIFVGFLTLLMIKVKVDHIVLWDALFQGQDVAANPDADFYLKFARDLVEQHFSFISITQTNLLSTLIALIAQSTNIKELIWAGNLLTPICCALTFLAVGLFFSVKSNFSPWGWVTSFLSLLTSYLCLRMGPGYIDTDLLNVFFVYLISALIYFQTNLEHIKDKYFLVLIIGVLNFLFISWYGHEGFTVLFSIAIILSNLYTKETWKNIFGLLGLFVFLSSLGSIHFFDSVASFSNLYITNDLGASNILKSQINVSELQTSGFKLWPKILFEWPYHWAYGLVLVIISLLGVLFWLFEDKKRMFTCFIPFIFIPLSFFVGDRFYIYTIPLFWFGLFFMLRIAITKIKVNVHVAALIAITIVVTVFSINYSPLCFFIFDKTCISKVTLYRFPTFDVTNASAFTNTHLVEENNTLLAWWDYGHYLALHTKFNLVLNNGNQFNKVTRDFVDAIVIEDEAEAYQKLKDLNQYSYNSSGKPRVLDKIYLLVNQDFVNKIPGFYKSTNIERIKAHTQEHPMQGIQCIKHGINEMMCNKEKDIINYKNGLVNKTPQIFKIIYANNQGKFLKEKIINPQGKDVLVNFTSGKDITQNNIIVPKWIADMTLMKLYLGQFDPKLFKLVYDHFPEARIYELK